MNLGIAGRKAIVCASSRGLGYGCAMALAQEGCEVVVNGRDEKRLAQAADEIAKATGAKVIPVAADVAKPEGQKALFAACPEPDILVNNNAGPPMRDFRELTREQIVEGVVANMAVAIELIQKAIDPMMAKKFGRIVNITSGTVKMPLAGLDLSSGARAGPDRVPRRRRAPGRRLERHHQFHAARHLRDRSAARQSRRQCQAAEYHASSSRAPTGSTCGAGKALRLARKNSAPPARSCARRRPATSPDRIS